MFRDTYFFPRCLGGSADCFAMMEDYPFARLVDGIKFYYVFQLGSCFYKFFYHIFYNQQDSKYNEYLLHHLLTLFLVLFSYLINAILPGSMTIYLHDFGDIFVKLCKIYYEIKNHNKKVLLVLNIIGLVTWIYTRLLVLPFCLINVNWFGKHILVPNQYTGAYRTCILGLTVMLFTLFIMHIYWTYTIIHAFSNAHLKKSPKSKAEKVEKVLD